jgi:hypothetical protein
MNTSFNGCEIKYGGFYMIDISNLLRVKNARLFSNIHENSGIGLTKAMYWEFQIDFEPFELNGSIHDYCHICCAWLSFDDNRWKYISNEIINFETQDEGEWSFYLYEHNDVKNISVVLSYLRDNLFKAEVEFELYLKNLIEQPIIANRKFTLELKYEGLEIQGQVFKPMISDFLMAKNIASEFVELDSYEEPVVKHETVYKFKPMYK